MTNEWEELSCDEQFSLATRIAAGIGYVLVPEPSIQDAEDAADSRLRAAVMGLETEHGDKISARSALALADALGSKPVSPTTP